MPAKIGPKRPVRLYLALWREKADLTQQELGDRIEPAVDKGTVSRWENAEPRKLSAGVIAAYAEAVGRKAPDMYRRPEEGPSLDALAADLDKEARATAADVIAAMRGRKAS